MPELPEVELVARSLDGALRGRIMKSAELHRARLAPSATPESFSEALVAAKILLVHRRGKYVIFELANGQRLLTHLRMSGRFLLIDRAAEPLRFTHASFEIDDGSVLVFTDQRHFGLMKIIGPGLLESCKELQCLAPEPFCDEFTVNYLYSKLRASRRSIKEFLLDQTKVCGLGNIYAAEALFIAGIRPTTLACRISRRRAARLYDAIKLVLREAIDAGSTLNTDVRDNNLRYYGGPYENSWRVYDREGEPCVVCQSPIVRFKHGGRSSYFCRRCQRA